MVKPGRNDPCPCGSGAKYKRCCLNKERASPTGEVPGRVSAALTNMRTPMSIPRDLPDWPIERAFVPVDDVWRATGLGTVMLVRSRPDGGRAWAMFKIDLRDDGISLAVGKHDGTQRGFEQFLADTREHVPPFEEGSPERASEYVWGAWAFGEAHANPLPYAEPFLAMVPKPPGAQASWLDRFSGENGLTPAGLLEVVRSLPPETHGDETKEIAVATTMTLRLPDASAALAALRASRPDTQGFRFIPNEPSGRPGVVPFDFVRPLPEGPRSIMPVRGNLQVQGVVEIHGEELLASTLTLSMAARLLRSLRSTLGPGLELLATRWSGPREAQAQIAEARARRARGGAAG